MSRADAINLGYLVTIVTFILALKFLSSPAHARLGTWFGAAGMAIAVGVTFAQPGLTNYWSILAVMAVFAPIGWYAARAVKMTAMPQMVALFNGVGGGAAALVALAEFHAIARIPGGCRRRARYRACCPR
jgi:NAD(P) transhydrogenase subunit beta